MVARGPRRVGHAGHVVLGDGAAAVPLVLVPGQYRVQEPDRFGQKIAQGALRYTDFHPYESSTEQVVFNGGYGLRRYSDWPDYDAALTFVYEADGWDTSYPVAILSPEIVVEPLPFATGPVVWFGEFKGRWLAVAGDKIYDRFADGTWVVAQLLPEAPEPGAVGVFGNYLILGMANRALAQVWDGTTLQPVVDTLNVQLYAYAVTTDHATAYLAGGRLADEAFLVWASTDGRVYGDPVACGGRHRLIRALAPGGPAGLVFVGSETELGLLDDAAIYRVLVPFEQKDPANGRGLRWVLGRGGDEQRGPLVLWFRRDGQPWLYTPAGADAGRAENIAPWGHPLLRPATVLGAVNAALGTARWLWYSVGGTQEGDATANAWLVRRDLRTGRTTPYCPLGNTAVHALGLTSKFGTNPLLFVPQANNAVGRIVLPRDDGFPPDDPACRYRTQGTLRFPVWDGRFPLEDKILLTLMLDADGLQAGIEIQAWLAQDDAAEQLLGRARASPARIPAGPWGERPRLRTAQLKLVGTTPDPARTPQLRAVAFHWALAYRLVRGWQFRAWLPAGLSPAPGLDLQDPRAALARLWQLRADSRPIVFQDRWGDRHLVRVLSLTEDEHLTDPDQAPQTVLSVSLVEVTGSAAARQTREVSWTWTRGFFVLDFSTTATLGFPLGPVVLETTWSVQNTLTRTSYPRWTLTGPGQVWRFLNGDTGEVYTLAAALVSGRHATLDFSPERQTAQDETGADLGTGGTGTMWGLRPDRTSPVTVRVEGASHGTTVVMEWEIA
jgi:hypothetical protein